MNLYVTISQTSTMINSALIDYVKAKSREQTILFINISVYNNKREGIFLKQKKSHF